MKKYLLSILILSISLISVFATVVPIPAGDVSGVWAAGDTCEVNGDISIPWGTTLNIEPGVVVIMQGHYMIEIRGKIIAQGLPGDSIKFTIADTTGFYDTNNPTGSWSGIILNNYDYGMNTNDTSVFDHCIFEYAKAFEDDVNGKGGALRSFGTDLYRVSNSDFRYNMAKWEGGALFFNGNEIPVDNCTFRHNQSNFGGAVSVWYGVKAIITNCIFFENESWDAGGALYALSSRSEIVNNIFANNHSVNIGGAIMLNTSDDLFVGNIVANNEAVNNGGGIQMKESSANFINNTIVNNMAEWDGGINIVGLCNSTFANNIIWGNFATGNSSLGSMTLNGASVQPNFYNNTIMGGMSMIYNPNNTFQGDFINTSQSVPTFLFPTPSRGNAYNGLIANWSVSSSSPTINKGDNNYIQEEMLSLDVYGENRLSNGLIDHGATEIYIDKISVSGTLSSDEVWTADTVLVVGDVLVKDSTTLTVSPGAYVEFQGFYKINVEGTIISEGYLSDSIVFTINDTTDFYNENIDNGGWAGIVFDNDETGKSGEMTDNDSSIFRYCIFEYGKDIQWTLNRPTGGAIKARYFSNFVVENCVFRNNLSIRGGAIGLDNISSPIITNSLFYNNRAIMSGGAIDVRNFSKPLIANNIISNNSAYDWEFSSGGGLCFAKSDAVVINNLICNNYTSNSGGGVDLGYSEPIFVNNTVVNNYARIAGGIAFGWSNPVLQNTIIKGNYAYEAGHEMMVFTESPKFYNCNLSDNWDRDNAYTDGEANAFNCVYTDPQFVDPTAGAGVLYDGLAADYRLTAFSLLLNKGINIADINTGEYKVDLEGNDRVNHGIVDIGAYEGQAEPIEILEQPSNEFACIGDTVRFEVIVNAEANYQWYINGSPIPGADSSSLQTDSVSIDAEASYSCVVFNGYGYVSTQNIFLVVRTKPEILIAPQSKWIADSKNVELEVVTGGSQPIFYNWYKNGQLITGEHESVLSFDSFTLNDEGKYIAQPFNECGSVLTNPARMFHAPQICLVTNDTTENKNLIAFDKLQNAPIAYYNIYRESIAKNIYDSIGSVPASEHGIFVDTVADPRIQAFWYKITAVDSIGRESDLDACFPHKTIHLLVTEGYQGGVQLDWDGYFGFPFGTYEIYRSEDGGDFEMIYEISSSNLSYTDLDATGDDLKYYVAVRPMNICDPAGLAKANAGPFSRSLSNLEDNRQQSTGIEEGFASKLNVYPNPMGERAIVSFDNTNNSEYKLKIFNLSGEAVLSKENITTNTFEINRGSLESGMYILKLIGDKTYSGKLIVE